MRRVYAITFAIVTALSVVSIAAQQAPPADASRKVTGGGITAAGWKGRVDANEAAKGGKIEDSKFVDGS